MSKKIAYSIGAFLVLMAGWLGYNQLNLGGGGQVSIYQTLGGSVTDLDSMPNSFVEDSSTTTNQTSDGGLWQQEIGIDGITKLSVAVQAIGGTATSSFIMKPTISYDGTTFFPITATSTMLAMNGTTTVPSLDQVIIFDPGTATTSRLFGLEIPAAKKLRLLLMGDNLTTDPNDGVQAFVQIGLEQGY